MVAKLKIDIRYLLDSLLKKAARLQSRKIKIVIIFKKRIIDQLGQCRTFIIRNWDKQNISITSILKKYEYNFPPVWNIWGSIKGRIYFKKWGTQRNDEK